MARVLLLNAVDVPFTASCLMPDNGLAALAACLVDAGHEVEILDLGTVQTLQDHIPADLRRRLRELARTMGGGSSRPTVSELQAVEEKIGRGLDRVYERTAESLERRLAREPVDLLGIKLWIGAGYAASLKLATQVARSHSRLEVFVGGPLATLAPEMVLREWPVVRAVCVGEGDETIVGLAEHCDGERTLDSVPNLLLRGGAGFEATERRLPQLDSLPRPTYNPEIYSSMQGCQQLPVIPVGESRGCPMKCSFCTHARLGGDGWRVLDRTRIAEHLRKTRDEVGARAFRFSGSFTPAAVYHAVADDQDPEQPIIFSGFAHTGNMRPDDLQQLSRSGLVALFFGVESGAQQLLDGSLGKKTTPQKTAQVLRASMDAGIFTSGSLIFPAPGETPSSELETLALLLEIFAGRANGAVLALPPVPLPGTGWWDNLEGVGFEADRGALLQALCTRKVRHFLPADIYEPLPLRLDGVPFGELAARTLRFGSQLRGAGIATNLPDETVLIARAAGIPPLEFQRLNREIFISGEGDQMQQIIRQARAAPNRRERAREPSQRNLEV